MADENTTPKRSLHGPVITKAVKEALAAGYSMEDIRGAASEDYRLGIEGGFTPEEVGNFIYEEYGFMPNYMPADDDTVEQMGAIIAEGDPEVAHKKMIDDLARELRYNTKLRRYTDEELNNAALYNMRDSVVAGPEIKLSALDRERQDEMIKSGELKLPEAERPVTIQNEVRRGKPVEWQMFKDAETLGEAALSGYQSSTTGLVLRGTTPNLTIAQDADLLTKTVAASTQMLSDLPTFVAGMAVSAPLAAEAGPAAPAVAIGAGFATTEGLRQTLMDSYTRGAATTPYEFAERLASTGKAMGKGFATGFVGGGTGTILGRALPVASGALSSVARTSAIGAGEIGALTATGASFENRIPTMEDFMVAGMSFGLMKAGGFYTSKFMNTYTKTGQTPHSLLEVIKREPTKKEDIASVNRKFESSYQPLFSVTAEALPENFKTHTGAPVWMYMSKNTADQVYTKAGGGQPATEGSTPPSYGSYAIRSDLPLLNIRGKSDTNAARLFKQFAEDGHPELLEGIQSRNLRDLYARSYQLFNNPTPEFIQWLKDGKGRVGKMNESYGGIQGIRLGDRIMVFDPLDVQSSKAFETEHLGLGYSAEQIERSLSVNESPTKTDWRGNLLSTYQHTFDKLYSLNEGASPGHVTEPYLLARMFAGVAGLSKHWLTIATTQFEKSGNRTPYGKSLAEVYRMGSEQEPLKLTEPTQKALSDLGLRINEETLRSNNELLNNLEQMRKDKKISASEYREARQELTTVNEALSVGEKDGLALFRSYLVAKRAIELQNRGINSGINPAAAKTLANDPLMKARFEPAAQELYDYQRQLVRYLVDAGRLSKKGAENILLQNQQYVPLNRIVDSGEVSFSIGQKTIKGSDRGIIDPLESIIRQTFSTLRVAERNNVMRSIAKEFGTRAKVSKTENLKDPVSTATDTQVEFYDNGRRYVYNVPKEIAFAAQQLDPTSANMFNGLYRAAAKGAGFLRAGAILHPEFAGRNFIRDQFSAYINSDSGYQAFYDFGRGLAEIKNSKGEGVFPNADSYYAEWLRSGGANSNLVSMDRNYTQEMMRTLLRTNNVQNSVPFDYNSITNIKAIMNPMNWGRRGYEFLQNISELSEEGTRVGEFIRARQQGVSPVEAAYRSREVTMDFARMGASVKALNAMSVFLNAKLQGADRSVRQLRAHPGRTMSRVIGGVVVPSVLLALVRNDIIYNSPDSDMAQALKEVPDWQKNMFWLIPTPTGIFRIPKPHEYGVPFANPAEQFIDWVYQNKADKGYLEHLYDSDYFNAVGDQYFFGTDNILTSVLPSVLTPVVEVSMNYSAFTGAPIIPPFMEKQLSETRYNRNTTELAKNMSRLLAQISPYMESNATQRLMSPMGIDHLIQGWTGTLGRDLWRLLDISAQRTGLVDPIKKPAKDLSDIPLIGAFMVKYPHAGVKSISDFGKEATEVEQGLNSIRALASEGRASSAKWSEELVNSRDFLNVSKIRSQMGKISNAIRATYYSDDLSPEEKRVFIDEFYIEMIELSRAGLESIKQLKKANDAIRQAKNEN